MESKQKTTSSKSTSANIYDISEKAGVSIATVSRVLNGSSKVSEKTRKKVQDAMDELNYQPNAFARGLGSGSMFTVGLMCTDASDTFLSAGLYHAERGLREKGYATILTSTGAGLENRIAATEQMLSKNVDGLILVGSSFVDAEEKNNEYIRKAADSVPVVIINGYVNYPNVHSVCCNDFESEFQATDYFLEKGKKNILHVYHSDSYSGRQKIQGYRAALGARGIAVDQSYLVHLSKDIAEGKNTLKKLYEEGLRFDAVVAAEDICAVATVKMAAECGLSVPEDVEIIGYNNSILSQCTTPELSTVNNHIQVLAEQSVDVLLNAINGEKAQQRKIIPSELILRGTTS